MTRSLSSAILIGALALPASALAQHSRGGDTPSVGTAAPSGGGSSGGSSSGGSSGGSSSSGSSGGSSAVGAAASTPTSPSGHRRGDLPANRTAVARGSVPGNGGTIVVTEGSGFYPWGYGGAVLGAGGYYGEYYGGYYGAYDPWYGWFPTYAPVSSYGGSDDTGSLKLKVTPSDASVYVDGFYVGIVDDFDGAFQKLRLDRGPHRIEMRAQGHEPLAVDVMIQEDFTITYRGALPTP
jgi:hypothetical protein